MTWSLESVAVKIVSLAAVTAQAVCDFAHRAEQLTRPPVREPRRDDGECDWDDDPMVSDSLLRYNEAAPIPPGYQPHQAVPDQSGYCVVGVGGGELCGLYESNPIHIPRSDPLDRFLATEVNAPCPRCGYRFADTLPGIDVVVCRKCRRAHDSAVVPRKDTADSSPPSGDCPGEVCGHSPDPASSGPSLAVWLEPAVQTILDAHEYRSGFETDCVCDHGGIFDWVDWRHHVTPLLCAHIAQALPDYKAGDTAPAPERWPGYNDLSLLLRNASGGIQSWLVGNRCGDLAYWESVRDRLLANAIELNNK
jgi:hypothetical protein